MLLSCRDIKKSFGDRLVLNGVALDIGLGDRIGLVGRNGTGKTTLANILTGYLDHDAGSLITSCQTINIGYLRQGETQLEPLLNELNNESRVNGEFQRLTSHLGIISVKEWSEERLQTLSGGEKTKLALAAVLASQPQLLILDEPTNHLDYQGIDYLVSELAGYRGAAIIISHDRYFLDQTVSQIAEIEKGLIRLYPGNYTAYRAAKQKERENQQHTYEAQQKQQKQIEAAISQLKTWSDKAHRESRQKAQGMQGGKEYYRKKAKKRDQAIKSQIKRLEKMRQKGIERPAKEVSVSFNLQAWEKGGRRLLQAEDISKSYGELLLFKDSSFYVNRGEKVGIIGPNGCGKTTLVRNILGQERLDTGQVFLSQAAKIAYVSQELPQGEKGSLKEKIGQWPLETQKRTIQLFINLGLTYDRLHVALGELSRGERMKIAIGLAIMGEYDLLILDEPTNHLDIFSREALEESLVQFPGTILLISHDRYLLERVCRQMLVFDQCKIKRIEGNLEGYRDRQRDLEAGPDWEKARSDEEKLLLETRISRVLSELSLIKPDAPDYQALDREYHELIRRRNELNNHG